MQFKREIKILGVFLTMAYSALLEAQPQPRANGASLGANQPTETVSATKTTTNTQPAEATTTRGTAADETAPSEITTMDPMDPARDSKSGSDATMGRDQQRARGDVSGTVMPEPTSPYPRY